jgi:hypothetical protein
MIAPAEMYEASAGNRVYIPRDQLHQFTGCTYLSFIPIPQYIVGVCSGSSESTAHCHLNQSEGQE